MNRRTLFGVGGSALLPLSLLAQDGTVPAEWEDRFTALEERVAAIEQRLDALLGEDVSPTEQASGDESQTTTGGLIKFSGGGTTLTDATAMEAGMYRVEAVVTVTTGFGDAFMVTVAGSDSFEDMLFIEYLEGDGTHEVSTSWAAKRDSEYAFQIESMSDWELTFEAM